MPCFDLVGWMRRKGSQGNNPIMHCSLNTNNSGVAHLIVCLTGFRLTVAQTSKGMSHFMSVLYVATAHLPPSAKLLGHLFFLTECRPLILCVYKLMRGQVLNTSERTVITT